MESVKYCSRQCCDKSRITQVSCECAWCRNKFFKRKSDLRSKNHFCNNSCAAKYNNAHKKKGIRRSKLEIYIEKQIKNKYKTLEVKYNEIHNDVGLELDFYFPSLKFAIEINGIFHYKPIYGLKKFISIQNNDKLKKTLCQEKSINLYILPYVEARTTLFIEEKYWNMFDNILNYIINNQYNEFILNLYAKESLNALQKFQTDLNRKFLEELIPTNFINRYPA